MMIIDHYILVSLYHIIPKIIQKYCIKKKKIIYFLLYLDRLFYSIFTFFNIEFIFYLLFLMNFFKISLMYFLLYTYNFFFFFFYFFFFFFFFFLTYNNFCTFMYIYIFKNKYIIIFYFKCYLSV